MPEKKIYILSGPVKTGKSTRLLVWALKKENAKGIITPISGKKRVFFDIGTQEVFHMEAQEGEKNTLTTGKYIFSKDSFDKAEKIIETGASTDAQWIVIDEIGPMELKGEGFCRVLRKILKNDLRTYNLVLVIRDKIIADTLNHFGISQYEMMRI
jgi:nucleoside-triphosphatase THEP1